MPRDIKELQIAEIEVGKYRSRQGPLVVEELCESIREEGLLEPRCTKSSAGYDLVYRERRLAACQTLGMVTVAAVIFTDSRKALLAAFTENLQRQNLGPVEEAAILKRLLATGMKQAIELARQFDQLFAQVKRERCKRNPDYQRIGELKSAARKVSKESLPLLSPKPRRAKQGVKQ